MEAVTYGSELPSASSQTKDHAEEVFDEVQAKSQRGQTKDHAEAWPKDCSAAETQNEHQDWHDETNSTQEHRNDHP